MLATLTILRRGARLGLVWLAALPALHAAAIDDCVNAMNWNHENNPDGLPSSSGWATKGRINHWTPPSGVNQIIHWGTVYEITGGNYSGNTRVHLRNHNLWVRWGSTWYKQQQFNRATGGNYYEDWRDDSNISPGDSRNQEDGTSVRAGNMSTAGGSRNYHFFATSIKSINSGNNGVSAWSDFRLVLHNTSGTDDRANAKYIVNVGADYYASGVWKGDVAIGRFLRAYNNWRRCYMHNMSEADLRANPPPFN